MPYKTNFTNYNFINYVRYFSKYSMTTEKDSPMFWNNLKIILIEIKKSPKAEDKTKLWDLF